MQITLCEKRYVQQRFIFEPSNIDFGKGIMLKFLTDFKCANPSPLRWS